MTAPTLPTARALRADPSFNMQSMQAGQLLQGARLQHLEAARSITHMAGGQERAGSQLLASEQRAFDRHMSEVEALDDMLREHTLQRDQLYRDNPLARSGGEGTGMQQPASRGGYLERGQSMLQDARQRGLVNEEHRDGSLVFQKYVRGLVTGDWKGSEGERRALTEGTLTNGGFLVPTPLSAQIIDLARAKTRVLEAGARIVPMETATLKIPRATSDPSVAWLGEGSLIGSTDPQFDAVTLTARKLAGLVRVSEELIEDSEPAVAEVLQTMFSDQIALKLDQAALYGTGVAPEPRGIKNTTGVTLQPIDGAANGGLPANYDYLIDAVGTLQDANFEPTAAIHSPRTGRRMAKLKDTQLQPLMPPPFLAAMRMLPTSQIPNTLTVGTSTDTSDVFVGDFKELYIGMRHSFELRFLNERYADTGEVGIRVVLRADIVAARPKAFVVVTGVR